MASEEQRAPDSLEEFLNKTIRNVASLYDDDDDDDEADFDPCDDDDDEESDDDEEEEEKDCAVLTGTIHLNDEGRVIYSGTWCMKSEMDKEHGEGYNGNVEAMVNGER